MNAIQIPTLDFEAYSEAGYYVDPFTKKVRGMGTQGKGGLPEVGTAAYAEHYSTEVITLSYDLLDGLGVRRWKPQDAQPPADLLEYVSRGGHLAAWNITFEWFMWNFTCVRKYGFPPLPLAQCHCDMAKSRRFSTPGGLGNAAKVLGGSQKDKKGTDLIRKLTRPLTPTKARPAMRWTRETAPDDFNDMDLYCDQDVVAEMTTAAHIPDLTDYERATWLADQHVNARGVQVDIESLDAMLSIKAQTEKRFTQELIAITDGQVNSVNSGAQYIKWLASQGVHTGDMQAETVKAMLADDSVQGLARRALEIRQALGGANIKKLPKFKLQVNSDGRLRNQYMYCGADRTGRWSAGGVQLQNITAKGPKSRTCSECGHITGLHCHLEVMGIAWACPNCGSTEWTKDKEWKIEAVESALEVIKTRDLDLVLATWGEPCALLAGCLRGILTASEGKKLVCCDFSAIEAVVLACLSRCQWRIDVFNTHGKIYEMSASKITGVPFEEFAAYKKANGMNHPLRKGVGKVAELASGYGGWIGAWKAFGADEHFDNDADIKKQIVAWREASPEIVQFWGGQHKQIGPKPWDSMPELFGLEGMAVAAILNPGQWFTYIDISYGVDNDILYCLLPSGRKLHYHAPRLTSGEDNFRRPVYKITFEGWNSNAQKGPVGWQRMETYGGRLAENATQAVAADIQAEALVRCESAGYPVVMHTHDELSAEIPDDGSKTLEEMTAIMTQRPAWASWWPIRGAGWTHKRYQKD